MSQARDDITRVLAEHRLGLSIRQIEALADELMVIVRETVARGFDSAADRIDDPVDSLRQWARDARAENHDRRKPVL